MGLIYQTIGKDKTFAGFFTDEGFKAIPQPLRVVISDFGALGTIREKILPVFKERATLLLAKEEE